MSDEPRRYFLYIPVWASTNGGGGGSGGDGGAAGGRPTYNQTGGGGANLEQGEGYGSCINWNWVYYTCNNGQCVEVYREFAYQTCDES